MEFYYQRPAENESNFAGFNLPPGSAFNSDNQISSDHHNNMLVDDPSAVSWEDYSRIIDEDNKIQTAVEYSASATASDGSSPHSISDGAKPPLGMAVFDDQNKKSQNDEQSMDTDDLELKRKAQNRAAQRAFRERKEQRVKELELKLKENQEFSDNLQAENEKLRKENTVLNTRNQVLMSSLQNMSRVNRKKYDREDQKISFPSRSFHSTLGKGHEQVEEFSYMVYQAPANGETMLAAGAIWQKIMDGDLGDNGELDIEFIINHIKDKARCDGFGPVYSMSDVNEAIQLARIKKESGL